MSAGEYRDRLIAAGMDPAQAASIAEKSSKQVDVPEKRTVKGKGRESLTTAVFDFKKPQKGQLPGWVSEVIDAHLAIEAEDAKKAGALGFMTRALVLATMPYKDPKVDAFTRQNGDFKLRIVAGYEGGIPYGIYPRLLTSWVATEAVRKQSPVIELGESLRGFLRDVMDLRSAGGGSRGSGARVIEQMKRLFGSLVTAQYSGTLERRAFLMKNIQIAESLELYDDEMRTFETGMESDGEGGLWTPQAQHEAGTWQSKVQLSAGFFNECVTNPVPIDLRAYKALRGSPLAMDIYTWLTYRLSYTQARSKPIRWEALMLQFGSGYGSKATTEQGLKQAVLDFKRGFLQALKLVQIVYPQANVTVADNGFVLLPSPTHVSSNNAQGSLF